MQRILILAILVFFSVKMVGQDTTTMLDTKAQEKIQRLNEEITKRGYNWKADKTSKSDLTFEEMKKLCGTISDSIEIDNDVLFRKNGEADRVLSYVDWKGFMSRPEDQECGDCWAHAATGVAEGLLHKFYGANLQIDMDEMFMVDVNSCGSNCVGGTLGCAFSTIKSSKVRSEQLLNVFPNYDNAYWTITSYNYISPSISTIQTALQSSPVAVTMDVYRDFYSYSSGVYHHVTGEFVGGHGVVILGYNDAEQYWICKNSWGEDWGEVGYFKIAYGECGINSGQAVIATVNSNSCFAKEAPNLIPSLNNAINYSWVGNEKAYMLDNSTLSDNISLSTGKILDIASNKSLNLSSYAILFNGGSLILNTGATISGLAAYIKTGTTLKGYSGSVQNAINTAAANQTVELLARTYMGNVSVTGKSYLTISGQSPSATRFENGISITNSNNTTIKNLTMGESTNISITGGSNTNVSSIINSSITMLYDYSGTSTDIASISGYFDGASEAFILSGGTGDIYLCTLENFEKAIRVQNNSNYNVSDNSFCGNGYDIYVTSGYVYANGNTFSRTIPQSLYGNVALGSNGVCGQSLAKTAAQENSIALIEDSGFYYPDSLKAIDEEYNSLLAQNKDNEAGLKDILLPVISKYKKFISGSNTAKDFSLGLQKTMHAYKTYNGKEEFYSYLTELESAAKYKAYSPVINKFKIWKYADAGNYAQAVETADAVLASGIDDTELLAGTLYEKGVIIRDYLADNEGAKISFEQLIREYPNSPLKRFAEAQLNTVSASKGKADSAAAEVKEIVNVFEAGNYPNPFNPATVIRYSIPEGGNVSLKVYDILGREVAKLVNEFQEAGTHSVEFNGSALSSGIYFYELRSGNNVMIKKMLMMK